MYMYGYFFDDFCFVVVDGIDMIFGGFVVLFVMEYVVV